jgi:hypothetical protein
LSKHAIKKLKIEFNIGLEGKFDNFNQNAVMSNDVSELELELSEINVSKVEKLADFVRNIQGPFPNLRKLYLRINANIYDNHDPGLVSHILKSLIISQILGITC